MKEQILPAEFQQDRLFKYESPDQYELIYHGLAAPGIQKVEQRAENESRYCLIHQLIYQPEEELWLSIKEMFSIGVKSAEASLFGRFELQLLWIGDIQAARVLNPQNLAQVIVNHGRKLKPSETAFFSYCGARFMLKYLVPLDWGKIGFKTHLAVLKGEREKITAVIKKLIKGCADSPRDFMTVIQDFSSEPIFRFGEEPQTEGLLKLFEKEKELTGSMCGFFYMNEKTGDIDLIEQFRSA